MKSCLFLGLTRKNLFILNCACFSEKVSGLPNTTHTQLGHALRHHKGALSDTNLLLSQQLHTLDLYTFWVSSTVEKKPQIFICEALRCVSFIPCTYKECILETQMVEELILFREETEGDVWGGSWRRARISPSGQRGGGRLLEEWIIRAKSLRPRRVGSLTEEMPFLGARRPGSLCSW